MEITIVLICLAINALLSAIEIAFVTASKPQLRQLEKDGIKQAKIALLLRKNPERTLSVLQVGITVVGAVAAAVGGVGAEESIRPLLQAYFGLSDTPAQLISVALVVVPLTYFSVVLGELIPKTIALRNPIGILLKTAKGLAIFDKVISPVVTTLEMSTKVILSVIRRGKPNDKSSHFEDESVQLGQLSQPVRQYVVNLVTVEKKRVRDICIPWARVISIDSSDSLKKVEDTVISSGHTRLPVLETRDVVGLINTKEFMAFTKSNRMDWPSIIRPLVRISSNDSLIKVLRLMQDKRSHMSMVMDNGIKTGIITMEDIFEEIIGDIYDEDDDDALKQILSSSFKGKPLGS